MRTGNTASEFPAPRSILAVWTAFACLSLAAVAQDPPPRPPRQQGAPSGRSDANRRASAARAQNPVPEIPLPPRPPRERLNKFLIKLRGAATVPASQRGVQIVQNGGYPELRVDGSAFFIHSAEFPYPRIPRDLWEVALDRCRELGINAITISIPWNWHEPQEGKLDFEGRSNPRRDLRALLRLIAEKEFKLIARLGPLNESDWPDSGYPTWLLTDAHTDRPLVAAQKWLPQLFRELAPYSSRASLHIPQPAVKRSDPQEKEISGPLLLIQAVSTTTDYVAEVRGKLSAAGLESVPLVVSVRHPRSPSSPPAVGEWFFAPQRSPVTAQSRNVTIPFEQLELIETYVAALATQPEFPAMLAAYQAGAHAAYDEPRPLDSPLVNTLISTRLLLAHGLRGLNHFPIMDGITPAGYEAPGRNRYARWDAALSADADFQPRARAVARTGQLLELWERFLGASHKRADFGLLMPPQPDDRELDAAPRRSSANEALERTRRVADTGGFSVDLLNASTQPLDQLLRHALIIAPLAESGGGRYSEAAQRSLVEYVRRGGTLVFSPRRPAGQILQELWTGASEEAGAGAIATTIHKYGQGKVVVASGQPDATGLFSSDERLTRLLNESMHRARVQPIVQRKSKTDIAAALAITQLVLNTGTAPLGGRTTGAGLLSITNLTDADVSQQLDILPPTLGARSARTDSDRINLNVTVPAGESLLLPLSLPLCGAARDGDRCSDEVIASGAELLRVERDGKVLELTMYVPAKASLILKLAQQPSRVRVDETGPEGAWTPGSRTFQVEILRGAAPDYLRVVKVHLPYTPHVAEKPDRSKPTRRDYDFAITDAVRLPLASDASLSTYPPLVVLKDDLTGRFIVEVQNYDEMGRDVDVKVDGPVAASDGMGIDAGELRHERIEVKPPSSSTRSGDSAVAKAAQAPLAAQLEVRSGRDARRSPMAFLAVGKESVVPYRFDFDRDAADEWVLEDDHLRLVFSPESGGRLVAIVDKESGLALTNAVGILRDSLAGSELSHTAYTPAWQKEEKSTALRLLHSAASGARIEKTARITAKQEFEITYRIQPTAGSTPAPGASPSPEDWFSTSASVPVVMHQERTTRFCWPRTPPTPATPQASSQNQAAQPADDDLRCEVFEPGGRLEVPAGVTSLQVRTPGSFAQRLEWQSAAQNPPRMIIEMKQYTALLRLALPQPAEGAAEFKLKYGMVVME